MGGTGTYHPLYLQSAESSAGKAAIVTTYLARFAGRGERRSSTHTECGVILGMGRLQTESDGTRRVPATLGCRPILFHRLCEELIRGDQFGDDLVVGLARGELGDEGVDALDVGGPVEYLPIPA